MKFGVEQGPPPDIGAIVAEASRNVAFDIADEAAIIAAEAHGWPVDTGDSRGGFAGRTRTRGARKARSATRPPRRTRGARASAVRRRDQ